MRGKIYLILTALTGAGGGVLAHWAARTGFDPATGLALEGTLPVLLLSALIPAAAALSLLWALVTPRDRRGDYFELYQGRRPFGGFFSILAAAGVSAAGLLAAWDYRLEKDIFLAVLGGVFFLSGLGMIRLVVLEQEHRSGESVMNLAPGFALCLWLVMFYRQHAVVPSVLSYALPLAAMLALALAGYCQAAFSFERGKLRLALWLTLCAGALALAAIPMCTAGYEKAALGGMALWNLFRIPPITDGARRSLEEPDREEEEESPGEEKSEKVPPEEERAPAAAPDEPAPAPEEKPAAEPPPAPKQEPDQTPAPEPEARVCPEDLKFPELPEELDLSFLGDLLDERGSDVSRGSDRPRSTDSDRGGGRRLRRD